MRKARYVSNELTHFVGRRLKEEERFQLLVKILRTGWLRPSHREEFGAGFILMADTRKPLSSMAETRKRPSSDESEAVRATAVCFCDIPANCLRIHMKNYGRFGLAFTKKYMLSRGASPVFYVAADAAAPPEPGVGPRTLGQKFDQLYAELQAVCLEMTEFARTGIPQTSSEMITSKHSREGTPNELRILGKLNAIAHDLDSMVFAHLKFFKGRLREGHKKNYYMEREWRKVGGLAFALRDVHHVILPTSYKTRFKGLVPDYTGKFLDPESMGQ
jgi:hypothetical protein